MPDNQFWRDASGRLTFEMFWVSADSYSTVCAGITSAFCLVPETALITNGLDIVFQDYRRGEQVVGLEWDKLVGFIVTLHFPSSPNSSTPDYPLKVENSPVKVKGWIPTRPTTLTRRASHDSTTQTAAPLTAIS